MPRTMTPRGTAWQCGRNSSRNHLETRLSEEFLKTVELPGTTRVGTGIGPERAAARVHDVGRIALPRQFRWQRKCITLANMILSRGDVLKRWPLIPLSHRTGRPRTNDMREVLNAIFYLNRSGLPVGH